MVLCASAASAQPVAFNQAMEALHAGDCVKAGDVINTGIEQRVPSLLYVAGLMLELGLCVDANAKQAASLYAAASVVGDPQAARRLSRELAEAGAFPRSYRRAALFIQHANVLRGLLPGDRALALPLRDARGDDWRDYWIVVRAALQTAETIVVPERVERERATTTMLLKACPGTPPEVQRDPASAPVSAALEHELKTAIVEGLARAKRHLPPPPKDANPVCFTVPIGFDYLERTRSRL